MLSDLQKEIIELKEEKNAIILAHNYQSKEVQEIADFLGDSLELCIKAKEIEGKDIDRANKQKVAVRKLLNAEKEAERKARTRHLIQLGALFEIANLDKRDPAALLGVLLKTAEINPNDMKWQIWKDLGQEKLNPKITK